MTGAMSLLPCSVTGTSSFCESFRPRCRPQGPTHWVLAVVRYDAPKWRVGGVANGKVFGGLGLPTPAKQLGVFVLETNVVR